MSKIIREKHIKIIELLSEATASVSRQIEAGNLQESLQLLAECQDAAITLGTHIEKRYGMQTQTVAALEQYCNALYQVSVAMGEGEAALEAAMREWSVIADSVHVTYEKEFPEKKEIVFLPYNASMWDSLESVWKAADEDPDCDAYVVPIPYYDLDAKHRFIEKYYEGDLYPDYVSITHYEDYDLEERHPDVIYIHNPYDEANRVTSIDPEYYSSRIKHFTEMLVYIPYFVLPEINPENQTTIDNIKHFCYLPGTIHADKVIVQSEDMRQIYINEYLKAATLRGASTTREELEEKILGLGSPKFDKAVNTKKEDVKVPEEWLKIIEKPDGSWKKIIFYNTSIAAFLKTNEQMLIKIKDVLRVFKEKQDEVALLWRPHPLMMQTIESMRPELKKEYLAIVQQYREEGWGIYDDSADMDRAVALSDAYYGDSSSVVQVYQETGKPVMVQNVFGLEEDTQKRRALSYFAYIDIDGVRWVSNLRFNGLFTIELNTGKVAFRGRFLGERIDKLGIHAFVKRYEDMLIFFPQEGDGISIYDMVADKFSYIELNEWKNGRRIVSGVVQREDRFLLFPRFKNLPVLEFSVKSKRVNIKYILSNSNRNCDNGCKELTRNICVLDEMVWFVLYDTNNVVSVNLINGEEKIYSIGETTNLQYIGHGANSFWLGENKNLLKWNHKVNRVERIYNVIDECKDKKNEITCIISDNHKVIVLPLWIGNVTVIDIETMEFVTFNLKAQQLTLVKDQISKWRDIKNVVFRRDELIIHPVSLEEEIRINLITNDISLRKYSTDNRVISIINFYNEKIYYENLNMKDYLEEVCTYSEKRSYNLEQTIGAQILKGLCDKEGVYNKFEGIKK